MILNDDPIVRCGRCGKEIKIPKNWFDGASYSICELGMGARSQHNFTVKRNATTVEIR